MITSPLQPQKIEVSLMSKQTQLIIAIGCLIKLTLHLLADSHSGFQGDELLHIEARKHLAFGYMEFPPLIGLLAFIQNLFGSHSVYVHHLFSHLASLLILIYVAKITFELGGNNKAIILVLLCILIAPSFGRSQQLFQPVVFSQLFWVLGFYQLTRFVKYLDKKSLWYLTILGVLGISVKYDGLFYIVGLSSLLLFKETRQALIRHRFWRNILVAAVLLLPNLIWQYSNDFPALQMFSRLYEKHLDQLSRLDVLRNLFISVNPLTTLVLIIPGFLYFVRKENRSNKPLVIAILLSAVILSWSNGKSYYFYPIILTILPFGALFWEQVVFSKKEWLMYPVTLLLFAGILLLPFGMPVYTFKDYLKHVYPFEKKEIEGGQYGVKYDEYYTREKWTATMQSLKAVCDSLPKAEKEKTMIWGKHYGQAGAVNLLGKDYNLPKAFSYHGSFYTWAPTGEMPPTVIALSYRVGDFFLPYFDEVILVKEIYNPYSENDEELYQRIYICKKPKQSFDKMKELFQHRTFE
jgi:hypothetical protein